MLGRDKVLLGRCWGLSPQLKSVEFSFLPNVIHELQSILYVKPLKKMLHFMGSGPCVTCSTDGVHPLDKEEMEAYQWPVTCLLLKREILP